MSMQERMGIAVSGWRSVSENWWQADVGAVQMQVFRVEDLAEPWSVVVQFGGVAVAHAMTQTLLGAMDAAKEMAKIVLADYVVAIARANERLVESGGVVVGSLRAKGVKGLDYEERQR